MSGSKIFLSYSHRDADRAWIRAFADSLQRRGATVWFDEVEIHAGESLREAIEKGLRSSDIVVSLVTPDSVTRPNLFFEIGAAVGMGKRVVAILPKDLDPGLLPDPLRSRRFLLRESPDETAEELLSATSAEIVKAGR
jgi:predicted nucleotide-binding protein